MRGARVCPVQQSLCQGGPKRPRHFKIFGGESKSGSSAGRCAHFWMTLFLGSQPSKPTSLFFFFMVGIVGNDCASPNHWHLQKLTDLRDLDLPNSSKFPTTESLTHKILGILPNLGMWQVEFQGSLGFQLQIFTRIPVQIDRQDPGPIGDDGEVYRISCHVFIWFLPSGNLT